jgi:hypothetical protein
LGKLLGVDFLMPKAKGNPRWSFRFFDNRISNQQSPSPERRLPVLSLERGGLFRLDKIRRDSQRSLVGVKCLRDMPGLRQRTPGLRQRTPEFEVASGGRLEFH